MNELLTRILDAHGGVDRWKRYEKVEATIVSGGGLFTLKGVPQDAAQRRMTLWLHEERSSVQPFGAPDQRTMFTLERIAIEKLDGSLVAQRRASASVRAVTLPLALACESQQQVGTGLCRPSRKHAVRTLARHSLTGH